MVPDSLRELWLRGIAFNAAAPADVLTRLLDEAAGEAGSLMCEGRDLPDDVTDMALRHPAERIRGALARNLHVDPARLAPLASDPSGLVRAYLAGGPRLQPRWVRPLPDDILVTFLTAQEGGEDGRLTEREIAGELWSSRQVPPSFPRDMAGHDHPALRLYAAFQWQSLTAAQRDALLDDPDPAVREAARRGGRQLDPATVEAELPPSDHATDGSYSARVPCHPRSSSSASRTTRRTRWPGTVTLRPMPSPGSPATPIRRFAGWSPPGPTWDRRRRS